MRLRVGLAAFTVAGYWFDGIVVVVVGVLKDAKACPVFVTLPFERSAAVTT